MDTLINHPAIQSGAIPFVISFGGCLVFGRLGRYGTAVALLAGLAISMVIVVGWQFAPLTSTRKLLVLALAAIVVAAALDLKPLAWRTLLPVTIVATFAAGLWLVWPVLKRREGLDLLLLIVVAGIYPAWITACIDRLHQRTIPALSALVALALGTGIAALLGASALLGQLGLAAVAAVGGAALSQFIGFNQTAGRVWTFPVALVLALVGAAATTFAKLPREALGLLAIVPLLALIPIPNRVPDWLRLMILTLVCVIPAGAAILVTWRIAGGVPM